MYKELSHSDTTTTQEVLTTNSTFSSVVVPKHLSDISYMHPMTH